MIKNNRGFTLAEVMVAVLVTLIISGVLLGTLLAYRHSIQMARTETEALDVLKSYMELQRNTPYAGIVDQTINSVTLSDKGTANAADDVIGTVDIDVTDAGNTKTVVGTVTWTDRYLNSTVNRNLVLRLLVAEP